MFEPLTRLVPTASGATDGSGLGLAISRAIVLAHGGRIWVERDDRSGTAVVFELSIREALPVSQEAQSREEVP